jgi:hypothetical protein
MRLECQARIVSGLTRLATFLQGLRARLLANLRQRLALPIAQLYAAFDLLAS